MGFFESLMGAGGEMINGMENLKTEAEWDKLPDTAGYDRRDYQTVDYTGDYNPEKYTSPEEAQYSRKILRRGGLHSSRRFRICVS